MATGITETTQFNLSSVALINSAGKYRDIKFQVHDLNIYQDIFNSTISGELLILDSLNLPTTFDMHGNEYLYIRFSTPGKAEFERIFRIYKISEYGLKTLNSIEYTIYFCSEEFILNQQRRISKSYKNVKTSDIVRDILKNQLKVSDDRMKTTIIEETKGMQNLIIPNMKPFEAINWISSFSISDSLSSAFVFFETQYGYNFISLEKLYADKVYKTITMQPKNVISDDDRRELNSSAIDRFNIKQLFDVVETASTGGYSSGMLKINLASQEHKDLKFDPITNKTKHLNPFVPFNNATNRFDGSLVTSSAYIRYFPSFQGDLTDKWLLQRAAQFSLLNSFRMDIQLPGDSQLCVGTILDLDFPFIQPQTSASNIKQDPYISGKYIVTSIRHRIFNNKYIVYLEICKDSNKNGYPPYNKTDSIYDKAKQR